MTVTDAGKPVTVVVSGPMVDTPDRARLRFPPSEVNRVAAEIRRVFAQWGVVTSSTVLTGGSRGADILASEAALARGARLVLCLAQTPERFEQTSVALPGTDWADRFRKLLPRAAMEVVPQVTSDSNGEIYAATNARLVARAQALDPHPHVLLVWNGEGGDGPGGTRDLAGGLGYTAPHDRIQVIDPTPRRYQARQSAPGKKKLLALDGGGIRGVLALEILRSIEGQLQQHYGRELVLGDYFDYIGGTSTGAIIAAALAQGHPVEEIQNRYQTLGRRVFRKRLMPMWMRSLYRDTNPTRELEDFFGAQRTLGDPDFRSLLLLVLGCARSNAYCSRRRGGWPIAPQQVSSPTHPNLLRTLRPIDPLSPIGGR
ncbi:patatin-like phospholipase family protein [Nocardia gipuzkoensis]